MRHAIRCLLLITASGCVKQNVNTQPLPDCRAIAARVQREIEHPSGPPRGGVKGIWAADRVVGNMYAQLVNGHQTGAQVSLQWIQADQDTLGRSFDALVMDLSGVQVGNVLYLEGLGPRSTWDWGHRPDTMLIDADGPYRARLEVRPDRIVGEMFRGCIARKVDLERRPD